MKKVKCSHCHGTGKVTCSLCNGRGKRRCRDCKGSGHSCPVCSHGEVEKTRWVNCEHCAGRGYGYVNGERRTCGRCDGRGQVKEKYTEICPNCHGDYQNEKYICRSCGGEGIVSCSKTERCSACGGTGNVEKVSEKNSRVFLALGMIGGLPGLHYAYIRRWVLFVTQLTLFTVFVALLFGAGIISEKIGIEAGILSKIKWGLYALVLIHWLIGISFVKEDGQGCRLGNEFKKGLFWLFFLLFGFTGAHLAYGKSKLLVFHTGFLMLFSLPAVNWGWGDNFIGAMQGILVCGTGLAVVEFLVAAFLSGGGFFKNGN